MRSNSTLTVAAVQFEMKPVSSFDEFADQARTALDEAGLGKEIVVLPELFTTGLFAAQEGWEEDEVSGLSRLHEYLPAYRELFAAESKARQTWILAGSTLALTSSGIQNVAHLFGPEGQESTHVKTHIFPAEGGWGTVEGDGLEVIDINGVTVGIAICYEAEIPEVSTILTRKGAEIILVPSYTFTEAGFYRVRHCAAARAIENQVYVVHCPVTGDLPAPLSPGWGRPSILSPCDLDFPANGVIAEGAENTQSTVTATLDLELLRENRRSGAATTYQDRKRRSSLYAEYQEFRY